MEVERALCHGADAHPLDQPVLELHNITWRLGRYADVVDGVRLVLADVLGYARGMSIGVRPEDETPLRGGPFEGAYVVRVGRSATASF